MTLEMLYKGLILGFSVAAPVGPIGILCINRTINKNFAAGFVSGLGAATADLIYGLIAGMGLSIVSNFLIGQEIWIRLIGAAFLAWIGTKTIMKKDREIKFDPAAGQGFTKDYFSTFLLTATNPMTILFFIAVFGGLGLSGSTGRLLPVLQLILGVFIGSSAWWLFLCVLTSRLKTRIGKKWLKMIDLISGGLILFFALVILISSMKVLF